MSNTSNTEPRTDDGNGVNSEADGADDTVDTNSSMTRLGRAKPWHRSRTRSILIVLWIIFTICLGVMLIVIFVQPQWLGGTSPQSGVVVNFGLYRQCSESWRMCSAKLSEFGKIPSAWKVSTVLVALAICSTFLSIFVIAVYWLACRDRAGYGFPYATGLQAFSALSLLLTCIIYPSGWDASAVTLVCGNNAGSYKPGNCEVKWAYWIGIISVFDALILTALSFFFIEHKVVIKSLVSIRRKSLQMNGITTTTPEENIDENIQNTAL